VSTSPEHPAPSTSTEHPAPSTPHPAPSTSTEHRAPSTQHRFELFVFDLDGTLIDSRRDIADAANELLVQSGAPRMGEDAIARMVGEGAAVLVARAFEASGVPLPADALERFLAIYDDHLVQSGDFACPFDEQAAARDRDDSRATGSRAVLPIRSRPRRRRSVRAQAGSCGFARDYRPRASRGPRDGDGGRLGDRLADGARRRSVDLHGEVWLRI
jgi:haloacid dehalogenase-like hydrolase